MKISGPQRIAAIRYAARRMGVHRLGDGTWFQKKIAEHVRTHAAAIAPDHWDRIYPGLDADERARRRIGRGARKAAAAGALAALGASTGELLALATEGLASPIGVPAAIASMAVEAGYTSLLQLDLACDLASIYGVPFDPEDAGEIATLFGLALEVDIERRPRRDREPAEDSPTGLTAALLELEEGELAARIGRKLLEESAVRNVVPVLGLGISARWNYVATRRLGATVKRYMRYRAALRQAISRLRLEAVPEPSVLVEGAWLLATVDGTAAHEETMALAAILDAFPEEKRCAFELDDALQADHEDWFEALAELPREAHRTLLEVLYLVAATDMELHESERRFLQRVGRTLSVQVDFDRIRRMCGQLACGQPLPEDWSGAA